MSGGSGGASARRVLVVGAGAIGGTVSACLAAVGADVTAVTTNEAIHRAVSERGFRTAGEGTRRAVRGRIELGVPAGEVFDVVLLATQPPQVEDAARAALGALSDGGILVCFQNGLCESRIARIAGGDRVVGAIVAWGASMPEPGLYDRTSAGGFTLGRLTGEPDDRVRELGALLEAVGLRYRRLRSSMLSAIERGRVPAIDFLNGEVVTHGARHGLSVPVNAAVVEMVRALARGEERPSRALLDRLYEATRPRPAGA